MTGRRQPSRAPARPPICRAIKAAREAAGLSQGVLAGRLGIDPSTMSRYEDDREPALSMIGAIERALGIPPGDLLARAGYVNGAVSSVPAAVAADRRLDGRARKTVLAVYRSLVR